MTMKSLHPSGFTFNLYVMLLIRIYLLVQKIFQAFTKKYGNLCNINNLYPIYFECHIIKALTGKQVNL